MLEIDEELVALEKGYEGSELKIYNLFKLACNADVLLKNSKPATKNQILRLLLSNYEIEQKRLSFNLLESFNFIKKWTLVQYGSWGRARTGNLEVNSFLLHH